MIAEENQWDVAQFDSHDKKKDRLMHYLIETHLEYDMKYATQMSTMYPIMALVVKDHKSL